MYHEIKSLVQNDTVFYSLVMLLVAIISFGLGRQSVVVAVPTSATLAPLEASRLPSGLVPEVTLGTTSAAAPVMPLAPVGQAAGAAAVTTNTMVIASKSGTKYHYPWCPGAKQIKEANRISFATSREARANGYTPAANCPGLE
jgi:hypothetical protein